MAGAGTELEKAKARLADLPHDASPTERKDAERAVLSLRAAVALMDDTMPQAERFALARELRDWKEQDE